MLSKVHSQKKKKSFPENIRLNCRQIVQMCSAFCPFAFHTFYQQVGRYENYSVREDLLSHCAY